MTKQTWCTSFSVSNLSLRSPLAPMALHGRGSGVPASLGMYVEADPSPTVCWWIQGHPVSDHPWLDHRPCLPLRMGTTVRGLSHVPISHCKRGWVNMSRFQSEEFHPTFEGEIQMRRGPLPEIIQLNSGSDNYKNSEPMKTIHQPSLEMAAGWCPGA